MSGAQFAFTTPLRGGAFDVLSGMSFRHAAEWGGGAFLKAEGSMALVVYLGEGPDGAMAWVVCDESDIEQIYAHRRLDPAEVGAGSPAGDGWHVWQDGVPGPRPTLLRLEQLVRRCDGQVDPPGLEVARRQVGGEAAFDPEAS